MESSHTLDAHTLIWYLEGNPRLSAIARAAVSEPSAHLILPVIALAEACHIVMRGKTTIPSVAALLADVDADTRIVVAPLDRALLELSLTLLTVTEMHDRLIVATALHYSTDLISCNGNITASGLVQILW